MPHCCNCGNSKTMASNKFSTLEATANPPPFGIIANFNQDGTIRDLECQGAGLDDAQEAFERPDIYFNVCPLCGSKDIKW